jgi:hypothetical protein
MDLYERFLNEKRCLNVSERHLFYGSYFSAAPLLKGMIALIKFPLYRCSPFFGNESKLSPDKNTRFPTINV